MDSNILIEANNISIGFVDSESDKLQNVVKNISLKIKKGEIFGVVGESGSGKSMTALGLMGLLPEDGIISGEIKFNGQDLLKLDDEKLRSLRGKEMSMVFQEPMSSLNPSMTVGRQVEEMLMLHEAELDKDQRKERVINALIEAGLKDKKDIYNKYPHELSGGMRQRVMIAMAMICKPSLLIADEPTTALDVTTQGKILKLILDLNEHYETTVILISHDLGVIKKTCSRVMVMEDGNIVEKGNVDDIFNNPQEKYTQELLKAMPIINLDYKEFDSIKGGQESKIDQPSKGIYDKQEEETKVSQGKTIVKIKDLDVYYSDKKGMFGKESKNHVVKNLSLYVKKGETLGIVGESGSGKSTLAKAIVGIIEDYSGKITLPNIKPQMVFQDPYSSLNPVKKVKWILEEPLKLQTKLNKDQRREKVLEILKEVDLDEKYGDYYLSELSGGQRQRVAIGSAIIVNPQLVVLDEPVSALDVTVQKQIITLLKRLKEQYNLSYIFISHDLNVVYQICDRIYVMHQGEMVEVATRDKLFREPQHEYTKELLKSVIY